jgi:hypothetical protein
VPVPAVQQARGERGGPAWCAGRLAGAGVRAGRGTPVGAPAQRSYAPPRQRTTARSLALGQVPAHVRRARGYGDRLTSLARPARRGQLQAHGRGGADGRRAPWRSQGRPSRR